MQPFDTADHPDVGSDERRVAAASRLDGGQLPSWEAEEWRYSPIADLELERYRPASSADVPTCDWQTMVDGLASGASPNRSVFVNGQLVDHRGLAEHRDTSGTDSISVTRVTGTGDVFADMNDVYATTTTVVTVKAGAMVEDDVVIVHIIDNDGLAVFPRLVIDAGESSAVNVLEVYISADHDSLMVPQIEVSCAAAANVGYVNVQQLGGRVWQVGSQVSEVGQQGTFRSSLAAFGGGYARMRSDCRLIGRGAHGDLDAVYFGDASQVLDFRTFQEHAAPDTTSNLLFKGVVDDASRAIYTGLIRVGEEARGTKAFQTNRNIKLGDKAWAESVPNLEIETDDVKCSHASTVGPIDQDQRFYLETRGVPSEVADRLIVTGFFDEVIADLPVRSIEPVIRAAIDNKLEVPS